MWNLEKMEIVPLERDIEKKEDLQKSLEPSDFIFNEVFQQKTATLFQKERNLKKIKQKPKQKEERILKVRKKNMNKLQKCSLVQKMKKIVKRLHPWKKPR